MTVATTVADRRIFWTRRTQLLVAGGGGALLVACGFAARHGTVGRGERRVFHAINDLPGWLYRTLWAFQQFGNLIVATVLVVAVALVLRRTRLLVTACAAVVLKLAGERAVKAVVQRQRPGSSIGDVVLCGAVPRHGLSFVSGHAAITAAFAVILTPVLPRRWRALPWALVILNGTARIYVGAHNPLDILGGIGLGIVIGGLLNAFVPPRSRPAATFHDPVVSSVP